jgi:lysophospholipid acyltransferase
MVAAARHVYALVTGFLLIYYPFGNGCFHALVPSLLTYVAMVRIRQHCGTLSWLVTFTYLLIW